MARLLILKYKKCLYWLFALFVLPVSGCFYVPNSDYSTQLKQVPAFLSNHFPKEIPNNLQASLITNTDTTSHCISYMLYQYGDEAIKMFNVSNTGNRVIAKYNATDTSIISIKRETVTYWNPEKKKYYIDTLQYNRSYYPVPFFETENLLSYKGDVKDLYSSKTPSGLSGDFMLYVFDFKPGKYWKGLKPSDYMPRGWENGYSKGAAISKSKSVVIHWFVVW